MKTINLIKKAREHNSNGFKGKTKITNQHVKLAVMYLKEELTLSQVAYSLYGDAQKIGHGTYAVLIRAVKEGYEKGIIKIKK